MSDDIRPTLDSEEDPSIQLALDAADIPTPEPEHCRQVARLALRLFDQLQPRLGFEQRWRDLLAAAAIWHDAGRQFGSAHHQRDSYELIRSTPLRHFDNDERLAIAGIARYHRGSEPTMEHPGYSGLRTDLRPAVDEMAAILRVAEGLDRSHLAEVDDLQCAFEPGRMTIFVIGHTYPMQGAEAASARAGLLRRLTGSHVEFVPKLPRGNPR
ncbi:MAG TPA: HD domain-containing protein [Thermomicrobiaceae bacterium]|nr:HD domain-containing protein [Thermomicrobiaceae bacterium]